MSDIIDICITSYFRKDFTEKCLQSIKDYTQHPHRVIVGDNGSDLETRDMLWDYLEEGLIDELILLPDNRGLEPLKQLLLYHVRSNMFVSTDNDILVPPPDKSGDWLSQLISLLEKDDKLVALSCTPQVFIGAHRNEVLKGDGEVAERDFVGGSMRLMRTDAVRAVGGWRSNPKDMNEANRGEERYICGKLKAKGYKVGYAKNVECFHMFGEDGEWGYKNVEHYHRDQWPRPKDSLFGTAEDWLRKMKNG